jgi:hypothetical protein
MTNNYSHIRPMKFTSFAVERCIRVLVDGNGHFILPVDSRQVESILEPIAADIGFGPDFDYSLIETQIDGQSFAMVVEADRAQGALYVNGEYGGVWWRVVGYEDGFPNDPFVLGTTDCQDSAQCTYMSLQRLLEPARVAVRVLDGARSEIVSNRPAEVLLLIESGDGCDDDEEGSAEPDSVSPWAGIKPEAAMVVPEKIQSLWDGTW